MTLNISKKHLILGISALAVLVVVLVAYHFYATYQYEKNAKEFKGRVSALQLPMAIVLEDFQKNWRSAIHDHEAQDESGNTSYCSDFNDAIRWRVKANKRCVDLINSHVLSLKNLMENMENPPSKYEKVQEKFLSIYNNVYRLKSLCSSPEGSLQSFSSDVNDLFADIKAELNETDLYISSESEDMVKYLGEFSSELEAIRRATSR